MSLLFNILKVGIGLRCSDQCPDFWELQLSVVSYGHNDKILNSFTCMYMKMQYITMEGQHTMTGLRGTVLQASSFWYHKLLPISIMIRNLHL